MIRVYLAGPVSGLSYNECTNWRDYAVKKLDSYGLIGLDPMRGKQYLTNEKYIKDKYDQYVLSTSKGITRRDMNDVRQSDIILVNTLGAKKISIGTILEIGAAFILNKPIILVIEKEENPHIHSMIEDMVGWIVEDLDQALEIATYVAGNR